MEQLITETGGTVQQALDSITTRDLVDCKDAWDFLDDHAQGDMLDCMTKFAQMGATTKVAMSLIMSMPQAQKVKADEAWEIVALAYEYQVRQYAEVI